MGEKVEIVQITMADPTVALEEEELVRQLMDMVVEAEVFLVVVVVHGRVA